MDEKPLVWLGTSLRDLRAFPELARRRAGFELSLVQQGLPPSDWKPMPDVGAGVVEIRIHTASEHRVFYLARLEEAVYVLHAFEKKTQRPPRRDLELASARLARLMQERQGRQEKGIRMTESTPSSGNVFQDLGFSPEEAANLKVRSSLMGSIRRIVESRGLKQAEAAELFGVTQPRVSDLMRGRIELFSIDALINMLAHAGHDVEISVEPRAA